MNLNAAPSFRAAKCIPSWYWGDSIPKSFMTSLLKAKSRGWLAIKGFGEEARDEGVLAATLKSIAYFLPISTYPLVRVPLSCGIVKINFGKDSSWILTKCIKLKYQPLWDYGGNVQFFAPRLHIPRNRVAKFKGKEFKSFFSTSKNRRSPVTMKFYFRTNRGR